MIKNKSMWILMIASLFCGCSLDEAPKRGDVCGNEPYTELLGVVGNSLSELSAPDADLINVFKKYHTCTETYPKCIYPTEGRYAWDTGNGFACSICDADELYCDVSTGGKKCIAVLNDAANCGECGKRCGSGICHKGACIDPNSEDTCGASMDNPDGNKCTGELKCIENRCQCPSGTLCDGHCIDINLDEHCGTTCDNAVACNTAENQTCQDGACVCPEGYLLREGHCIDPKRNNKYCGATNNSDGQSCDMKKNFVCKDGECRCSDGYVRADNGQCVNALNDNEYCGKSEGELVKCMLNSTCQEGICTCFVGMHKIGNNCVFNDSSNCGARGDGSATIPSDINYKGYECLGDTSCINNSVPMIVDGTVQTQTINICSSSNLTSTSWNSNYNIYNLEGKVVGHADPGRVKKCSKISKDGKYYTECECMEQFSGVLCQDNLINDVTCPKGGIVCTAGLVCMERIDDFGKSSTYCGCPSGMVPIMLDETTPSCIEESSEHCGTTGASKDSKCSNTQVCENGQCQECGYNQMRCLGKCLDNYDLNPYTDTLSSFSERHVLSCDMDNLVCEDGYGRCSYSFGCDDSCCMKPDTNYKENFEGEFKDFKCCHKSAPKKCRSGAVGDGGVVVQYACRSECAGYETDVTEL